MYSHHSANLSSIPLIPVCYKIHISIIVILSAFSASIAYSDSTASDPIASSEDDKGTSYISTLDGYSTLSYRVQNMEGDRSDQDVSQYLSLSLGDSEMDRVTWYFFGSLRENIDDSDNSITKEKFNRLIFPRTPAEENPIVSGAPFFSIDDSINDGFTARPYEFYADIKDISIFKNIRAGRQYIHEVENLHFDGLKMESENYNGIRLTTFAGMPVHFFETSDSGDLLAGVSVEFQPINDSRIRLNYTYVNDNNNDIDGNDDNLFELSWRHNIKEWWNVYADFSMIDQTGRDAEIRSGWMFPDIDMDVNVSVFKQLSVLEDFTTELDDFNVIIGDFFPYTEYSVNAYKGFLQNFGLAAGFNIRELNDAADEGQFNHEFDHYYVTLSSHNLPLDGSSVSITGNFYDTNDDENRSLGLDFRQKINEKLTLSGGTYYSLFKFDSLSESERDNVKTYFLNTKYQITKKVEINMEYEFERFDQDSFHTVESALEYRF